MASINSNKSESNINLTKLRGGSKHSRRQITSYITIPELTMCKWTSCKLKQIKTTSVTTLLLLQIRKATPPWERRQRGEDPIISITLSQTSFLKRGSYLYFVYNLNIYKQFYIFLSYPDVITQSTIQICNSKITKQSSNPLGLVGILLLIAH